MHTRAWPGIALALCAASAIACNNGPTFGDAGTGDGTIHNGGTGQVRVHAVTPNRGPIAGGTAVAIDGSGFSALDAGDAIVIVGDRVATEIAVVDDFTITAVVPEGAASGPTDVIVANKNGYGDLGGAYTYNDRPTITAVTPPRGDAHGGTAVTITGTGFQAFAAGVNHVTFGDLDATDVTVVSDTQITATTPPGVAFTAVDVGVANVNGAGSSAKAYTYSAKGLVAASSNPDPTDGLYFIDLQTGTATRFLKTEVDGQPVGFHALATDASGTIWGVTHYAAQPYLVEMDPYGQTVTKVGVVTDDGTGSGSGSGSAGQTFECTDLEFVGNNLYCTRAGCCTNELYKLDTTTAAATSIGTINLQGAGIVAIGGIDYATSRNGELDVVDLATGAITNPISVPIQLKKPTEFQGQLYVIGNGNVGFARLNGGGGSVAAIYQVDTSTGQPTLITQTPLLSVSLTKVE